MHISIRTSLAQGIVLFCFFLSDRSGNYCVPSGFTANIRQGQRRNACSLDFCPGVSQPILLTALDAAGVSSVIPLIRKSVAAARIPYIIVTHRIADAVKGADRACLIDHGKVGWEGVPGGMPVYSCRENCEG
jgi:hypothetical protein